MSELTNSERIAMLRVLKRQVDDALKDAEGQLKDSMLEAYQTSGVDRVALLVGDVRVGQMTVVPAKSEPTIMPGREAEALAFLAGAGLTREVPVKDWREYFSVVAGQCVLNATGEVCDAIALEVTKAPYIRPSGFKPDEVRDAFQARGIAAPDIPALTE